MKLKDIFVTETIDDSQIMVCTDSSVLSGLVRSNKTAAFIVDCLRNDVTEDGIYRAMAEKFDGSEAQMRADIAMVVEKLRSIGAIAD